MFSCSSSISFIFLKDLLSLPELLLPGRVASCSLHSCRHSVSLSHRPRASLCPSFMTILLSESNTFISLHLYLQSGGVSWETVEVSQAEFPREQTLKQGFLCTGLHRKRAWDRHLWKSRKRSGMEQQEKLSYAGAQWRPPLTGGSSDTGCFRSNNPRLNLRPWGSGCRKVTLQEKSPKTRTRRM